MRARARASPAPLHRIAHCGKLGGKFRRYLGLSSRTLQDSPDAVVVGWLYVHLRVSVAPAAQAALRSSMHWARCAALLALLRVAAAPPPDGVTGVTAIVIPVHDSVPLAQGCVAMIAKHTPSDMYRVFVVDDQPSGHASRSMAQFMGWMNSSQHHFISMSDRTTGGEARAGSTQAPRVHTSSGPQSASRTQHRREYRATSERTAWPLGGPVAQQMLMASSKPASGACSPLFPACSGCRRGQSV